MRVGLIGAFDRNNYGDLLMPIIFKKQFLQETKRSDISFSYYGLRGTDMSIFGGVKTKPLRNLLNEKESCSVAVFVGGEVLSADYSWMYINIQDNWFLSFMLRAMRKMSNKLFENFAKKILHGQTSNPWVYDNKMLHCEKVIYNTVGGRKLPTDKFTLNALSNADYISVRDKVIQNECCKKAIKTELSPDSVILISDLFPKHVLRELAEETEIKKIESLGEYFVLQVNRKVGDEKIEEIARQAEKIWTTLSIKCLLVPIGYAQGHEDDVPLRKIKKRIGTPVEIIEDRSIYNIAYSIACSQLYIGTSLHGAITSISFKIPHMALTSEVAKLTDFLETWETTPKIYTEVNDMCSSAAELLNVLPVKDYLSLSRLMLLRKARANFRIIDDIIIKSAES